MTNNSFNDELSQLERDIAKLKERMKPAINISDSPLHGSDNPSDKVVTKEVIDVAGGQRADMALDAGKTAVSPKAKSSIWKRPAWLGMIFGIFLCNLLRGQMLRELESTSGGTQTAATTAFTAGLLTILFASVSAGIFHVAWWLWTSHRDGVGFPKKVSRSRPSSQSPNETAATSASAIFRILTYCVLVISILGIIGAIADVSDVGTLNFLAVLYFFGGGIAAFNLVFEIKKISAWSSPLRTCMQFTIAVFAIFFSLILFFSMYLSHQKPVSAPLIVPIAVQPVPLRVRSRPIPPDPESMLRDIITKRVVDEAMRRGSTNVLSDPLVNLPTRTDVLNRDAALAQWFVDNSLITAKEQKEQVDAGAIEHIRANMPYWLSLGHQYHRDSFGKRLMSSFIGTARLPVSGLRQIGHCFDWIRWED